MTTKDQAIALDIAKLAEFAKDLPSSLSPPAPDCRTCVNFQHYQHCNHNHNSEVECTNGDQYQPAPKVVLWRTE